MARDGSGVYSLPAGYVATTGATIEASQHNPPLEDLALDMNTARPVVAGGTGGASATVARDNLEVDGKIQDKATAYTALVVDRSTLMRSTAAMTLSLTAAATLGDGWFIDVLADTGTLTIDPDGAETIDGVATIDVIEGKSARIRCNGTAFYSQFYNSDSDKIGNVVEDTTPQLGGVLDTNGFSIDFSKGANVASAAELLLLQDGNVVNITGTTDISSIETTADAIKVGSLYWLKFAEPLNLINDNTSFRLITDADIAVEAGDIALIQKKASQEWRMYFYQRQSGKALTPSNTSLGFSPTATYTTHTPVNNVSRQNTSDFLMQATVETVNAGSLQVSDDDSTWVTAITTAGSDRHISQVMVLPQWYWRPTGFGTISFGSEFN